MELRRQKTELVSDGAKQETEQKLSSFEEVTLNYIFF
jgi:hypothetical protein